LDAVLPAGAQRDVKAVRLQTTLNNMAIHAELTSIARHLDEAGIRIAPLKGTWLTQRLFGSLDARQCGDIDILVRESEWDAARTQLVAFGYAPIVTDRPGVAKHAFHDIPLVRISNSRAFMVELHRQMTDPRFVTIDHRALWSRIDATTTQARGLAELPAAELLVYLATHLPKHDTGVLRLLADIDHLIAREHDELDWEYTVRLATTWHADGMLYFTLTLAAALLSSPIPAGVLQQLKPPPWKRATVPFLVGPETILRPPEPQHLRANRFRIAYCLMLRRGGRELRSYWHYIMMPPRVAPPSRLLDIAQWLRQPFDGIAWTALALGSALRDRYRSRTGTLMSSIAGIEGG
jgi:hypothetical protein